ncbi:MAG: bifunctional DNA primase/polymerase [Pseudonocardiales bacterium]
MQTRSAHRLADALAAVDGAAKARTLGVMHRLRHPPGRVWSLRHAAATYAAHGWPIVPGAYSVDGKGGSPRPDGRRARLCPLPEQWQDAATTDVMQIGRWWSRQAWVILLAAGPSVNVVEMPAALGQATVERLADGAGPVALGSGQRWLLYCAAEAGTAATSDDQWRAGVLLHTTGSWVPVPPIAGTRAGFGWFRPPWVVGWHLPPTRQVLAAARDAAVSTCPA